MSDPVPIDQPVDVTTKPVSFCRACGNDAAPGQFCVDCQSFIASKQAIRDRIAGAAGKVKPAAATQFTLRTEFFKANRSFVGG